MVCPTRRRMDSCRKTQKPLLLVHKSTFILKVLRTQLHVQAQELARVTVRPRKLLSQGLLRQKQDVWVLSSSFSLASMMWKVCVARQLTAGSGSSLMDRRAGTQKRRCLQSDTAGLAGQPCPGLTRAAGCAERNRPVQGTRLLGGHIAQSQQDDVPAAGSGAHGLCLLVLCT